MKGIINNGDYTFDASLQTVTLDAAYTGIGIENILLITNLVDGEIIYQFNNVAKAGTIAGLVITLAHDTTSMADTDELMIIFDWDGINATVNVAGTITVGEVEVKNDSGSPIPVSAASLPLPSGAATSANQSTVIGHLDGVETLLGTIDADTGSIASDTAAIKTAVETIDNAIAGSEMQVDIVSRPASVVNKTDNTSVLSLQSNAASTVLISSDIDVSDSLQCSLYVWFGRRSATTGTAGCIFRLEGSPKTSGNDTWIPLATYTTNYAACEAEAVSGTVNAGQKVITVASTTNLTIGDYIYIDNGTIANSEWARIKSIVTNTSVTVEDDLTNAQTGATVYDAAESFLFQIDLTSIIRLRLVVNGASFTQAHAVKAIISTADSTS